ncbi:murein transglycosylase A [Sphingomonas sp.]|uniref:murein transglycosylase A n=1 Tax=Sphingomonas sp. TaxID=28214 RepID=UPI003AFFE77B
MIRRSAAGAAVLALVASACVGPRATAPLPAVAQAPVHPAPPSAAPLFGADARSAGIAAGPSVAELPIDPQRALGALAGFRSSCAVLVRRQDASGLTRGADWRPACAAAASWPGDDAVGFFRRWFETGRVGEGKLLATGYYEPEIAGAQQPTLGYDVPVYGVPDDLVEADLGQFAPDLQGRKIRGRVQGNRFVPYYDRGQIEDGAIAPRARPIAWAADPIALFFLQIQGSGRLRLPAGGIMRVGYAGQNGQPYTGIGRWMLAHGMLAPGQASMQGIVGWLRAHPDQADGVMRQNRAYVFLKPISDAGGPPGALGVPVIGHVSVAADPKFVPLGAPIWLSADRTEAAGLWIAQDTGGAIKGPNRVDTFWGAGAEAERIAGGMSARGLAYLLLPQGTVARLNGGGTGGDAARP